MGMFILGALLPILFGIFNGFWITLCLVVVATLVIDKRSAVVVTDEALIVQQHFRTLRIPWGDIASFDYRRDRFGMMRGFVRLANGGSVALAGVRSDAVPPRSKRGALTILEVLRGELEARRGGQELDKG